MTHQALSWQRDIACVWKTFHILAAVEGDMAFTKRFLYTHEYQQYNLH